MDLNTVLLVVLGVLIVLYVIRRRSRLKRDDE